MSAQQPEVLPRLLHKVAAAAQVAAQVASPSAIGALSSHEATRIAELRAR